MKIIKAKLKEPIQVAVNLEIDWSSDWLVASRIVESTKKDLVAQLRNAMHNKVAEFTLEDVEFKVIDNTNMEWSS